MKIRNNNWRRISAWILAGCILGSVISANHISGVMAVKRDTQSWVASGSNASAAIDSSGDTERSTAESKAESVRETEETTKATDGNAFKPSPNNITLTDGEIVFYIDKGEITFGAETASGYTENEAGEFVLTTVTHAEGNQYVVKQESADMTTNNIRFSGDQSIPYEVTLDQVNMGQSVTDFAEPGVSKGIREEGMIIIPGLSGSTKMVHLFLKGENIVKGISYYTGYDGKPSESNRDSYLKIAEKETEGSLYIPKKVSSDEIQEFIQSKANYNHWNAGIGGTDRNEVVTGLTIESGNIQVLSTLGDNCSAIGGGGNGMTDITINGGNITAICNGTGAAIGGGIGYRAAGGKGTITINGGTVYAENYGILESDGLTVGGVAIGGGSSFEKAGSKAAIVINDGNVTAYAAYGNGIGSGNSAKMSTDTAAITITGGTIKTNAIGGGSSETAVGGNAEVIVEGGETTCVPYGNASDRTFVSNGANYIDAFGIGGGTSKTGNGGNATVTVKDGTLDCGTGTIGGGASKADGNGGDAVISVSGGTLAAGNIGGGDAEGTEDTSNGGNAAITVMDGTLDCTSIGGGNSKNGTPGAVVGSGDQAGVVISGGTVRAGSIGGGTNEKKEIGFATADISGGVIQGQFILANTDTSKKCTFTMNGGTINNEKLGTGKYTRAQANGGAVYLSDPNGVVSISGGAIENCTANLGGAVYMTNGIFTLSGVGKIENCKAEVAGSNGGNGGAVYLEGGSMEMSGGGMVNNTAAVDGGGVYITGGNFTMESSDTKIDHNTASSGYGGGVYVGDGNVLIYDGHITSNKAKKTGGGMYVSANNQNGKVTVLSGTISGNETQEKGGGIAVESTTGKDVQVTVGICETHPNLDFETRNFTPFSYAAADYLGHTHGSCPVVQLNKAEVSGGGFYLNGGSSNLTLYCLKESGNTAVKDPKSNGVDVENGTVTIGDEQRNDETARGNITMSSPVMVTGGKVDIWGNMKNPDFKDQISVDIKSNQDHYIDHRRQATGNTDYKIQYYENFTENGATTGLYTAKQYAGTETVTIEQALYSHDGWTIQSWNTQNDGAGVKYDVGKQFRPLDLTAAEGMDTKERRLTLYAIWKKSAYTIKFESNRPQGAGGSGNVADQECSVLDSYHLNQNQFTCVGYIFNGWNTQQDGNGTSYADKAEVSRLSERDGSAVTLYAQWIKCTHEIGSLSDRLNDAGDGIVETCSCGGHTAEIRISGNPGTYNGEAYPVKRTVTGDWKGAQENIPIIYSRRDISSTGSYELYTGEPTGAGEYLAEMTVGSVCAKVTYTIAKASQDAPGELEYTYTAGRLVIKSVTDGSGEKKSKAVYMVKYTENESPKEVSGESNEFSNIIMDANSTFEISAYYVETANYKRSDISTNSFTFSGNIEIAFKTDMGVKIENISTSGTGSLEYRITVEQGYHKDNFTTAIALDESKDNPGGGSYHFDKENGEGVYALRATPDEGVEKLYLLVTISGVVPDAVMETKVTSGENFDSFTGNENIRVSQDSAFTVQYDLSKCKSGDYSDPKVFFGTDIPENTSLILQADDEYWYYIVKDSGIPKADGLLLSAFTKMGGTETYSYRDSTEQMYRLIVDFSQVNSFLSGGLNVTLQMTARTVAGADQEKTNIPELKASAAVKMEGKASFGLARGTGNNSLKISCTPSSGIASIWTDRGAALVLQAEENGNAEIPEDLVMKVKKEDRETNYTMNARKQFILPLGAPGDSEIALELVSKTVSASDRQYHFTPKLYIAGSEQDGSPMQGYSAAEITNGITLTLSKSALPSVKIMNADSVNGVRKRLYSQGGQMKMNLELANADGYTAEAEIYRKNENGSYASTAAKPAVTEGENTISLSGMSSGCYYLNVRIKNQSSIVEETAYYFIIE